MLSVQNFATALDKVIPLDTPENARKEVLFNVILVKFGARPSYLIGETQYEVENVMRYPPFLEFINQDPSLRAGWFSTEYSIDFDTGERIPREELWIYNSQLFFHLFQEKDVSYKSDSEIHSIRGSMLGYPCSGEFFYQTNVDDKILSVAMLLDGDDVYGYWCYWTTKDACIATEQYMKFEPFAQALNMNLELVIKSITR